MPRSMPNSLDDGQLSIAQAIVRFWQIADTAAVTVGNRAQQEVSQLDQLRFVRPYLLHAVDDSAVSVVAAGSQNLQKLCPFFFASRILDVEVNSVLLLGVDNRFQQIEQHLVVPVVVSLKEAAVV